uniref:Uncharacterized protein n=1 Tax=Gastroclonium compressum TaxID=1852973 RepID=A0A173FZX7_GASCM|nr:hypothetical protein [Coeloseira compressa]ANH09585.1 hypothetical protein [Coeloseira compressa]
MLTQNILNVTTYSNCMTYCSQFENYTRKINDLNNHHKKKFLLTSIASTDIQHQSFLQNLANKKLVSNNLVNELKNKYWQETIFLSLYQPLSNEYLNSLKSNGISISSNQNRKFLLNLSRALKSNRIKVSANNIKNINKNFYKNHYIKYIWKKGFNLPISLKILNIKQNIFKSTNDLSQNKDIVLKKIQKTQLPLFTIINKFNQIVLAEHPKRNISSLSLLDQIYKVYSQKTSSLNEYDHSYEGLFFINPNDALEYKNYVSYKYENKNSENRINVIASTLEFYYHTYYENKTEVKWRIIPDLTELGNLLFKYKKLNHIKFHAEQNYGYNYFQGQPVYLIQSTLALNASNKKKERIEYFYINNQKDQTIKYKAIFLNYKTALVAWKKFIEQNQHYKLPKNPNIIVYNLQDYIKKEVRINSEKKHLFIPSQESFNAIKNNEVYHYNNHFLHTLSDKLLYMQILTKRIIWSLTSKKPGTM